MGGVGLVIRRTFVRLAAPVVFLAAVSAVVLIVRGAIHRTSEAATVAPAAPPRAIVRATPPAKRLYYRIQPGDTLDVIASRFRTTVRRLLRINRGLQPEKLAPGQRIRIR